MEIKWDWVWNHWNINRVTRLKTCHIMLAFKKKDKNLQPWIPVHEFPTIIIVVVEPLYLQYCKGLPLLTSISENNCSNEESGKKMETFLKHDVTSEWRHIIWGMWLSYHVQYSGAFGYWIYFPLIFYND